MSIGGAMSYFLMLSRQEQAAAIKRMAAQGWTDHGLAGVTKLSVEQIRRILAEPSDSVRHD